MSVKNFLGEGRCVCDIATRLTYALRDEEAPPCPVHEVDEVAREKADRDRAQARENADRLQRAADELRIEDLTKAADAETRRAAAFQASALANLREADPLAAMLASRTGHVFTEPAKVAPALGIGDTRIEKNLAAQLGATLNASTDQGDWQ